MKLTDENLDYMDCRPPGRDTGINVTLPWLVGAKKRRQAAVKAGKGDPPAADAEGDAAAPQPADEAL